MSVADRNSRILQHAQELGFAVPHFNYSDSWELKAILDAAEELDAPVFVATNTQSFREQTPAVCGGLAGAAVSRSVPVATHLDHSASVALCREAIDVGYSSVMIDCSQQPLEENIANTRAVVEYAHPRGVMVEAELGRVLGNNEEGSYDGGVFLADADEAERLVKESGLDSLAIGIGTAHGFYTSEPKIHFDVIEKVRNKIDIPLVMHGCSGVPAEDVQKGIRAGICKVNVGTQLHYTYVTNLQKQLAVNIPEKNYNVFASFVPSCEEIRKVVVGWIELCMATGMAPRLRAKTVSVSAPA